MPMRGELSVPPFSRSGKQTDEAVWGSISALAGDSSFVAVCAFSMTGLLTSLFLAAQFPLTDEMVALLASLEVNWQIYGFTA
jgi:hypothetical protein